MIPVVFKTHPFYGFVVHDTPLLWVFSCVRHTYFMVLLVYKTHPLYGSFGEKNTNSMVLLVYKIHSFYGSFGA